MAAQIQWVKGQEKDVMIVNDKQGTLIFSTPDMDTVWKVTKIKSIKIEDKDYEVTSYLAPHEDNGRGVVHGIYPRLTIEGLTEAFCNPRNPPTLGVRKIGNSSSAIVTFKDETVPREIQESVKTAEHVEREVGFLPATAATAGRGEAAEGRARECGDLRRRCRQQSIESPVAEQKVCIVPAAYGNDRRDSNQEDPEPVTYDVPVISADLPGRRLVNNGVDYFNNSGRRRRNDAGNLTGTALCLVVACLALMALLLYLSIAALWLRGRYRATDKALYTTLSASDADLPTPATSSTRGRWHLSGEGPFRNTTAGTARWSRKVKKNSKSAPVIRNAKTTGCSLDKKGNSPLRSLTDGGQPSATLTESTEAKTTPSPAITTAAECLTPLSLEGVVAATVEGRKLRVKSSEAMLPLRSYSVARTDTADRQPSSDHRSDQDDSGQRRSRRGSGKRRKRRVDPRDLQHHGKQAFVIFYVTALGTSLLGLDAIQQLGLLIDGATLRCRLATPVSSPLPAELLPRRSVPSAPAVQCDGTPAEVHPPMPATQDQPLGPQEESPGCSSSPTVNAPNSNTGEGSHGNGSSESGHGSRNPPSSSGRDGEGSSKSAPDSRNTQSLPAGSG
ncbi:hypothetical protein HPB49_008723 [Dermacentor silvarum]|uniref:Uncharacterized protein n=1 Tax=Dermacentor silvarum TaxID=543639 RepID=A0ACB8DY60_DERSI|nr:hypothetical protein HPB49_008723 [Dermacentor silvarum]